MGTEQAGPGLERGFDETIHAPVRLRISGILRHVEQIDFAVLRDTLGIADATLSKHLRILVDAGYATTTKSRSATRSDARRLTWIAQTRSGRAAFDAHVEELRRIATGTITDPDPAS
ncbi:MULTISPECIES: transcriptional regulator [Pseudonocardia]|uniref:Helix-turn-helix domain protein n=2 Tax=Pseudonocardia TaxID=1847 RepID=A0A1Y2N5Q1_PSEAH|nr:MULTISPECIES: transcriptional regulator [Pseudonocardia]OSY42521.1 Helix-turn-helix domain protein [Pseudonocardia autotrophica]TDN76040.1 winged helix DNA-binding protein [Pseudonocardia autotrophica]BBG00017.1 transcriptional regulator [Pseudonocardia autotrophica]GEC28059.1 transcriptional regulator [Pseudonocardia saturnea]